MITGAQIRAARALLDWSARDLSRASRVSPATIQRLERTPGLSETAQARTLLDLQTGAGSGRGGVHRRGRDRPGVRLAG